MSETNWQEQLKTQQCPQCGAVGIWRTFAFDNKLWAECAHCDSYMVVLAEAPKKKPYSKPVLRIYGNIRDMTETSTMGMHADAHGRRSIHKTA
ncbi:MAG TPA: hypothetical protein VF760_02100 [Xanthobacteraceae bacterium]